MRRARAILSVCGAALLAAASAHAREVRVPLQLDPAFLRTSLLAQIYTDPGRTARVFDDGHDCSRLVLSDPVVEGGEGRLRVRTQTEARVGVWMGGVCTLPVESRGFAEVFLEPSVEAQSAALTFRVVDSNIYDLRGRKRLTSGVVWDWVKGSVHPRLATLRIDLARPLAELRGLLPLLLPSDDAARTQAIVDSLALVRAEATPGGVTAWARLEVPEGAAPPLPVDPAAPEAPLTPAEYARFEAALGRFDGFLTFVVKHAGKDAADTSARQALLAVLLDERGELLELLDPARPHPANEPDPVRLLFVRSWARLAPALRQLSGELPGERALQLLGFVTAADAVTAIDALGPDAGLVLSEDGLRRLARLLAPGAAEDPVASPSGVDPELREIFGFGAPLEGESPEPPADPAPAAEPQESQPAPPAGDGAALPPPWLFIEPEPLPSLATRLYRRVPDADSIESYLLLVRDLLRRATELTLEKRELPQAQRSLFGAMVLATAWKESCWRQWVRQGREIRTIRSSVGALGLMQVSPRVWRGFYEPRLLANDIGYNARAGSEILLHYFVDYAIPRGEGKTAFGSDGLARASYAAYNGGPGHLQRWRNPRASASLRKIDETFFRYFQSVKAGKELEVKSCWGG